MPRILLVAAVTVAAAVAVPSLAHGATIHQDGRTPHRLLLQAEPGETNLVSVEGSQGLVIRDDGAADQGGGRADVHAARRQRRELCGGPPTRAGPQRRA